MSLVLADRVRQTTTSTGTGTITLNGSVEGFQSFTAIGNGNTTYYTISGGAQWEVGIGTYSSGTLARTTVISSSTGSKLDLAAGTKDVFVTLPASVAVTSGTDVTFTKVTSPTVQATNSAGLSLKNLAGTTQLSMGAGGGDNLTLSVSTNINGANAQVDISPTGTGHVHMKPTGTGSVEIAPTNAGTLDNLVIGGVTPKNGTFVNVAATTGTVSTAPSGGTDIVNKTYADGLAAKWGA
jgi:plastocyanin